MLNALQSNELIWRSHAPRLTIPAGGGELGQYVGSTAMKTSAKQIVKFLVGPWMILPQAFVVAGLVGGLLYEPPEIHHDLRRHLFLQGSTDLGGGCLFAGTMALYVAFGFTSAWWLVLRLHKAPTPDPFIRTLARSLWSLKFHIAAFVVGGTMNISYDRWVTPNDFRDMFVLMCLIYGMSIILIAALASAKLSMSMKLAMAPMFTVLWLTIGSDGNTARAGQLVQSGQDPQPVIRGGRHGVMMSWHRLCDSTLGDVRELQRLGNTNKE